MELNISSQSPAGPSHLPVNGLGLATVRHNVPHYTASGWRRKVISMFLTVESAISSNISARH